MNYLQFQTNLNKSLFDIDIKNQYQIGPVTIKETEDKFLIGLYEFDTLKESLEFLKNKKYSDILMDITEEFSDDQLVNLLKEHYPDIKITNTKIKETREMIESKQFQFNSILESVQSHSVFPNKLFFILEDQSKVGIDLATFKLLNSIFENQTDIESYMKESKINFMNVVKQLEGYNQWL